MLDLALMLDHAHRNAVLTDLRGDVMLHFEAQVLEHQIPWESRQNYFMQGYSDNCMHVETHRFVFLCQSLVLTIKNLVILSKEVMTYCT